MAETADLTARERTMLAAIEAFEDAFAVTIENDDEDMGGADTVDLVCSMWPMFQAALEAVRGRKTAYPVPDEEEELDPDRLREDRDERTRLAAESEETE